jgi:RHS repeat-associated protein
MANDAGAITTIKYTYDALGNRISQTVNPPAGGDRVVTWYVRDAQGNIMSTYKAVGNDSDLENLTLIQSEKYLYGSSRLGLVTVDDADIDDGPGYMENYYQRSSLGYERGFKQYELTNHLGNVLATVSDRKFAVPSDTSSLIDHYEPDIVTAQDYYPFGMMSRVALPNSGRTYKFGFNGKMNDDEVKEGLGNQQDYGMRINDPRIGRFLSTDPLSAKFPYYTPYQFTGNNPIRYIDLDGAEQFDPQSVPKGVTHITSATAPGVVQQTKSVWIGNYELRGLVGVNGEAYWVARYHYKEGKFKGGYNDEWVVGPDGV